MSKNTAPQEKIQERLSINPEPRFLHSTQSKPEILLVTSLLGGPFLLLFALMGRSGRTSLWPLGIVIAVFAGWAFFIGIGHRSISEDDYFALPQDEKIHRLFYESMWWRLYQGGFALLASGAVIWGAMEIMIRFDFLTLLPLFLGSYLLLLILCFYKHQWIAKVYTEGAKKHKWLKPLVTITFGTIGLMPIVGGVGRMIQVSEGREAAKQFLTPVVAFSLWTLATTLVVLSVVAFLIAHAQYKKWKP
ncbi:MAG: hypothetical protein GY805_19490 [Chloroflexi bacterium]|nr:hypothetical protein [Chloroflexota bacterium]